MKPSSKANILGLTGAILMIASVFHKPLGLPDSLGGILMIAAVFCFLISTRMLKRAKVQVDLPSDAPVPSKQPKRLWLIILSMAVGCGIFSFTAKYTGLGLPFSEIVIISVVSFTVLTVMVLFLNRCKN